MLRRISALLTLFFTLSIAAFAQRGKISGRITNDRNDALGGVSIKIVGSNIGSQSGVDGNYILSLEAGKSFQISFSYVGYQEKIVEVSVKSGEDLSLNILLDLKVAANNVVVKAQPRTARGETTNALIAYQKNTNTVAQVLSAEAIRRSPDRSTGEALKRIPGTSVQEGKYLIVRGLADRYNTAMLNGVLLSSTEPDRKTFSFDIFPAAMVDNIIINKAFVPELPGEWAGGLVQINTKDIPSSNFFSVQLGTGFNTETIGKDFYSYKGGKYDWLGLDDKTRMLPDGLPTKSNFQNLSPDQKTEFGKKFTNTWDTYRDDAPLNASFQLAGGFNTKVFGKKVGAILSLTYNKTNRNLPFENRFYTINGTKADINFDYFNNKYSQDVLAGALANVTIQLNNRNKISFKNLLNINASDFTVLRTGKDFETDPTNGQNIRAKELGFRSNIYFNTQAIGEHSFGKTGDWKFKWTGAFNILDQYIPDQRRIQYNQTVGAGVQPFTLNISGTLSQKSGSRFYSNLSDYIYTAGGDLSKNFTLFQTKQTVKGGYLFQVKDRLFDARPFSVYLPLDNAALRLLPENVVFSADNFGTQAQKKFAFDELGSNRFRYLANTILNAGYLQFDNQFSKAVRFVWGLRVENYDQLIGSVKQSDDRHVYTKQLDYLPGANLAIKINPTTNLRISGSQTVIRPEFRELTNFAFFDFELGATVLGRTDLKRTKVTNLDIRYEIYPRAGELFTLGVFYKYFDKPIEAYFNQSGVGTSNTFNYLNADKASGYGVEFEMRKKLDFIAGLQNFTLTSNLSYIYNKVEDKVSNISRPLQGQSPYVINFGLLYDIEKQGISTTLLYNQIGRRILYVGNDQIPAIWENPRPLLDFQLAKKLLKNKAEVRLNISDILNQTAYFYHDTNTDKKFDKNKDPIAISRKYGSTVGITFGYTIK